MVGLLGNGRPQEWPVSSVGHEFAAADARAGGDGEPADFLALREREPAELR